MAKPKKPRRRKAEAPKPTVIVVKPTQHQFEAWIGQLAEYSIDSLDLWRTLTAKGEIQIKLKLGK